MPSAEDLVRQINGLITEFPELADDEELRTDCIEGETEILAVLERLTGHVQIAEANASAVRNVASSLADRKKRFASRAAFFRALIKRVMDAGDLKKVILPIGTVSVSRVAPAVIIRDETALPDEFVVTTTKPNKKAIAEAIKAGGNVPGAMLSNGSETLSIRI
jgi:hypothetical protein